MVGNALRRVISSRLRTLWRRIKRQRWRVLPGHVTKALDLIIGDRPDIMMVHSSLSKCGNIIGGSKTLIKAWSDQCETLCLPTHSYCYPERAGEVGPLFDRYESPSEVGMVTEWFRKRSGVTRSIHSTHSIAALGPDAEELCCDHYRAETPCGRGTPYERMLNRRCAALMFGVSMYCYSFFHTAEDASGSPLVYDAGTIDKLRVKMEEGKELVCLGRRQARNWRRFRETDRILETKGMLVRQRLGMGELLYIPDCSVVHSFMVERLKRYPDFLFASCSQPLD